MMSQLEAIRYLRFSTQVKHPISVLLAFGAMTAAKTQSVL